MTRYRPVAALVAACLTLFALAGCTVTPPAPTAPSPQQVVSDAVAATLATGSARITAELATFAGSIDATGPVRFAPFAADLSATVQGREVSVRSVDGSSWVRFGQRWTPVASGLVPIGALPGAVRAASAVRDVVDEGQDPVGGAPATRYRGTVDLDALAASDPAAAGPVRELSALVTPRPGVETWVGADGRVVQVRLTPAGAPPVTVGLTDLGLPVEVTPPI